MLLSNVAEKMRRWEGGELPVLDLSIMLQDNDRIGQRASQLKGQWNVDCSAVIQSTRPVLGRWIIRFQHLVRKLTWWYLEPVIQQIRRFQRNAALATDGLARNQRQLWAHCEDLTKEVTALRNRLEALEARESPASENLEADT
jgi:hypothetical protein